MNIASFLYYRRTILPTAGSNYQSCLQIFKDIVKNEGPRHLMKGLVARLIVVPSFMSVFYVINEELEKLFLR